MHNPQRVSWSRSTAVWMAVLCALPAAIAAAQTSAATSSAAQPAAAAQCPAFTATEFPINGTLRLKVVGYLDSSHLKLGKEIWFEAIEGESYPGCTLNTGSAVYARVVSVSSTKKPDSAELALSFDRADCDGHAKTPVTMALLGVLVPAENAHTVPDTMPPDMAGGQQDSAAPANAGNYGRKLNPGGEDGTIKPGIVVGLNHLTLEPQGGPECSARLTSTKRKIEFGPSTVFFLALMKTGQQ